MKALPIDPILPEICRAFTTHQRVVLEAPPGAGKTTRVPRALLDASLPASGSIVVLEPRRIAARMSACRVAEELGEPVGARVGYITRFDRAVGADTQIRFVTEGVLTRQLVDDPELAGVGAVLLDEFHERHLSTDVALAHLRRLTRGARPDLLVGVMSATLDAAPVAELLDARRVRCEGREFEVDVSHLDRPDDRSPGAQVASALRRLVAEGLDGDVLVFLPGLPEIRRVQAACEALARQHDLSLVPLAGSLSTEEQDRAVRAALQRKVILSTNVAETSITIDGVVAVVDLGLARIASHAPWSGLPMLVTGKISQASAIQRAGRAGRTQPGRCLRLYTRQDFEARPAHLPPEVCRLDLCEAVLELCACGVRDPTTLEWLDAPPAAALDAAVTLLIRLGAVRRGDDGALSLSDVGRRMVRLPVHPRAARVAIEAQARGHASDGCALAALISERAFATGSDDAQRLGTADSDLLAMLDRGRSRGVSQVERQLRRRLGRAGPSVESSEEREHALLVATLTGFPDRVGRIRRPSSATRRSGREIVFAEGGMGVLWDRSVVHDADLCVAVEVEERVDGRDRRVQVRSASAIQTDWLLELYTDDVHDEAVVTWDASAEKAVASRRLRFGTLVLDESRDPAPDPERVARVLVDAARAKGLHCVMDLDALARLRGRVAFADSRRPDAGLPDLSDPAIWTLIGRHAPGVFRLADLRDIDWLEVILSQLAPAQRRLLDELAPERVRLGGGRSPQVRYEPHSPPSIESRLQDFFGMDRGPSVSAGEVPLLLHLLAPNRRAVQVTTDLSGFWTRHYPDIARELRRRYPKHSWPDDPTTARPPPPGRSRR